MHGNRSAHSLTLETMMKTKLKLAVATMITLAALTACGSDSAADNSNVSQQNQSPNIATLPIESLSADEQASLLFMREEEKLAYDVYIKLWTCPLKVDNQDIRVVYENLLKGSRNHLRAFVNNLAMLGITHTPQYMNPSDYQAIINSPTEN